MANKVFAIFFSCLVLGVLLERAYGASPLAMIKKVVSNDDQKKEAPETKKDGNDSFGQSIAKQLTNKAIDSLEDSVKQSVDNKMMNSVVSLASNSLRKRANDEIDKALGPKAEKAEVKARRKRSAEPDLNAGLESHFKALHAGN